MAEKNNNNKNGVLSIVKNNYKYENLILLFLAIVSIVLGSMVLMGVYSDGSEGLVVDPNVFFIGDFPEAFAWILIVIGIASVILAVWPFYKPSFFEVKRIAWPSRGTLIKNSAIVFGFILIMGIFFVLADLALNYVVDFFRWLADKMI